MENNDLKTPEAQKVPAPSVPDKKHVNWKSIAKEVVYFILIAVCIVLPFRIYIAEPYLVDGKSMDPTFTTGDYLIIDKLSYRLHEPKRNTVLVFHYPNDPRKSFIKRVIGLPGETIEEKGNVVTIYNKENPDGFKVDQSYVVHELPAEFKITLKDDEYFVMGDNRAESFDSRSWGPLNKKYISGKPILRLLPITQIGFSPGQDNK